MTRTKIFRLGFALASTLTWGGLLTTPAFATTGEVLALSAPVSLPRCNSALMLEPMEALQSVETTPAHITPPALKYKLGISIKEIPHPLRINAVESRFSLVEKSINKIATALIGKAVGLKKLDEVTTRFLLDKSTDPYFVKLERAFLSEAKYDSTVLQKSIPATGPGILIANHPKNGSEGITLASAISKIRPDVRVVMNSLLENYPGMSENAFFVNTTGTAEARLQNAQMLQQVESYVRQGGMIVIFSAGDVSTKQPGSKLLPVDRDWRPGVAQILEQVPETQVVLCHVGGESSPAYYKAKQKRLGLLSIILHVRELSNNIGYQFELKFSERFAGAELLKKFPNDHNTLMQYLRARTYLLADSKTEAKTKKEAELIAPADPRLVYADISGAGKLMYSSKGIEVFLVEGAHMTPLAMNELGRAREESFRSVDEGSGKATDTDKYDKYYSHMIAMDAATQKILGAYRLGKVDEILRDHGISGLYTYEFFDHHALISARGHGILELGRSFADPTAGTKALRALDSIWKGLGQFMVENPKYQYMIGPVSISNAYSLTSKVLIKQYLKRSMNKEFSDKTVPRTPPVLDSQFLNEISLVDSHIQDLKELNRIVTTLDGVGIPSLLTSYGKMNATYMAFNFDKDFNSIDGLIMVDMLDPKAEAEASKHFGDKWEQYKQQGLSLRALRQHHN